MSPIMRARLINRIVLTLLKLEGRVANVQLSLPGMEVKMSDDRLLKALQDLDDNEVFDLACALDRVETKFPSVT